MVEIDRAELKERFELIETMIAEGRRSTERWGWVYVLWGVAYYVAVGWASWGQSMPEWGSSHLAWPVTMVAAAILTVAMGVRTGRGQPHTTMGSAVVALWIGVGTSMMALFLSLGVSGRLDQHVFVAAVAAMLGAANGASGIILKWKMQFATAVVWWASAVAACFVSGTQLTELFLADLFVCQIVFGVYVMVRESRRRRRGGLAHAGAA